MQLSSTMLRHILLPTPKPSTPDLGAKAIIGGDPENPVDPLDQPSHTQGFRLCVLLSGAEVRGPGCSSQCLSHWARAVSSCGGHRPRRPNCDSGQESSEVCLDPGLAPLHAHQQSLSSAEVGAHSQAGGRLFCSHHLQQQEGPEAGSYVAQLCKCWG